MRHVHLLPLVIPAFSFLLAWWSFLCPGTCRGHTCTAVGCRVDAGKVITSDKRALGKHKNVSKTECSEGGKTSGSSNSSFLPKNWDMNIGRVDQEREIFCHALESADDRIDDAIIGDAKDCDDAKAEEKMFLNERKLPTTMIDSYSWLSLSSLDEDESDKEKEERWNSREMCSSSSDEEQKKNKCDLVVKNILAVSLDDLTITKSNTETPAPNRNEANRARFIEAVVSCARMHLLGISSSSITAGSIVGKEDKGRKNGFSGGSFPQRNVGPGTWHIPEISDVISWSTLANENGVNLEKQHMEDNEGVDNYTAFGFRERNLFDALLRFSWTEYEKYAKFQKSEIHKINWNELIQRINNLIISNKEDEEEERDGVTTMMMKTKKTKAPSLLLQEEEEAFDIIRKYIFEPILAYADFFPRYAFGNAMKEIDSGAANVGLIPKLSKLMCPSNPNEYSNSPLLKYANIVIQVIIMQVLISSLFKCPQDEFLNPMFWDGNQWSGSKNVPSLGSLEYKPSYTNAQFLFRGICNEEIIYDDNNGPNGRMKERPVSNDMINDVILRTNEPRIDCWSWSYTVATYFYVQHNYGKMHNEGITVNGHILVTSIKSSSSHTSMPVEGMKIQPILEQEQIIIFPTYTKIFTLEFTMVWKLLGVQTCELVPVAESTINPLKKKKKKRHNGLKIVKRIEDAVDSLASNPMWKEHSMKWDGCSKFQYNSTECAEKFAITILTELGLFNPASSSVSSQLQQLSEQQEKDTGTDRNKQSQSTNQKQEEEDQEELFTKCVRMRPAMRPPFRNYIYGNETSLQVSFQFLNVIQNEELISLFHDVRALTCSSSHSIDKDA